MKLPLQIRGRRSGSAFLRESEPFLMNDRAILIHRPREATIYNHDKFPSHIAVKFWCGNTHNHGKGMFFLSEPPIDRLVCEACEARAIMAGLPTSSELAGRHVCIGKLKAVVACAHG